MKIFFTFLAISFLSASSYAQDTTNAEEKIKKVIEGETLAFANADLVAWSGYFVHKPYLRWSVSATMFFDGWDALYNGAKAFLESQSGRKDACGLHQITRNDWNIHISGNTAWVKFVQVSDTEPTPTQQFRVLENNNGKWEIAMLVALH